MGYYVHIAFCVYMKRSDDMGKTTRVHPVSLHVLRGAAEYCGFHFGRLRQTKLNLEGTRAWYTAIIVEFPAGMDPDRAPVSTMLGALRSCYASDVWVTALWRSRSGVWSADLDVELNRSPVPAQPLF
jgi:hypothetical protein